MQIDIPQPQLDGLITLFNCNNFNLRNTTEIEKENSLVNDPNFKGKVAIKSETGKLGKH